MAQKGINKVILVGNLGGDPDVRYMPNGGAVASITIATSETWRDKTNGQPREKTEWHRVALFGKLAEVAGEYLRKGSQVYIEGQLQTSKWQDQSGQDRYTTEVVVKGYNGIMQMLGGRRDQSWGEPQQPSRQPQRDAQPKPQYPTNSEPNNSGRTAPQYDEPPMDFDDDIPFAPLCKQYRSLSHCM